MAANTMGVMWIDAFAIRVDHRVRGMHHHGPVQADGHFAGDIDRSTILRGYFKRVRQHTPYTMVRLVDNRDTYSAYLARRRTSNISSKANALLQAVDAIRSSI
jgi:hypothetical protein